jgi:hypothetical protein
MQSIAQELRRQRWAVAKQVEDAFMHERGHGLRMIVERDDGDLRERVGAAEASYR